MTPQQPQGQQPLPDGLVAQGARIGFAGIQQQLGSIMQLFGQAFQVAQKKMPAPPSDPAVEMTFKAAMAEVERKSKVDQAEQARKAQEVSMAPMLENMKNEFAAKLELERMAREDMQKQYAQQVELMKNDADNRQHQMTELVKNRDDNETAVLIAQLKNDIAAMGARNAATTLNFDVSEALQQALRPFAEGINTTHGAVAELGQAMKALQEGHSAHQQKVLDMAAQLMQQE